MKQRTSHASPLLAAPLLVVAWFLWPLSTDLTVGDVLLAAGKAYLLFSMAWGFSELTCAVALPSKLAQLVLVFGFAGLLSLSVGYGLALAPGASFTWNIGEELAAALSDAAWCAGAGALVLLTASSQPASPAST